MNKKYKSYVKLPKREKYSRPVIGRAHGGWGFSVRTDLDAPVQAIFDMATTDPKFMQLLINETEINFVELKLETEIFHADDEAIEVRDIVKTNHAKTGRLCSFQIFIKQTSGNSFIGCDGDLTGLASLKVTSRKDNKSHLHYDEDNYVDNELYTYLDKKQLAYNFKKLQIFVKSHWAMTARTLNPILKS
ncbi:hypothetical protein FACS189421_09420 [Bacteroidia bacterium]|nr:hypothetical protein FACS189421_09420 [Bacteroidia bacterium]